MVTESFNMRSFLKRVAFEAWEWAAAALTLVVILKVLKVLSLLQ